MSSVKSFFQRITASFWINLVFLVTFSAILIVNSWLMKSTVVGIVASLAFLYMNSVATGKLMFHNETHATQVLLGLTTFTSLMAFAGIVLIFAAEFTPTISMITVIAVSLVLFVASTRRKLKPTNPSPAKRSDSEDKREKYWPLVLTYLLIISLSFYLLLIARTSEGGASVWLTIPNMFIPVFLLASFLLGIIVLFTGIGNSSKLALISVFSFLVHSLFLLVWYPGRYGDPWSHLAEARYVSRTGMMYAYERLIGRGLFVDVIKFRAQEALVVYFERMFYIDIYWAHIILIPLLWAIFVPFLSYKIAESVNAKNNKIFPLLAALSTELFSSLIIWGAVAVPNSLGFLFFFLAVALFFLWKKEGGKRLWILGLLASVVSFFAHPQTGMFAFMFFFWGTALQKFRSRFLMIFSYSLMLALYPLSMYYFGASFSLNGLIVLENFLTFQSEISTILLVIGIVGLTLGILGKYVNAKDALMLFGFYATIVFEYYLTRYGMLKWPYGPGRILVMADLLFAPFVALGLLTVVDTFSNRASTFSPRFVRRVKINLKPYSLGIFLVCLFLSLQVTSSLYKAYPRSEIVSVQPAGYEVDAINYIRNDANGDYVVLCSPTFASLATGFLGVDYSYHGSGTRGWFGVPEYDYPPQRLYIEMTKRPSISIMEEAMSYINAETSYFVISTREQDFDKIVESVSDVLPVNKVFGNGKLYIFKYPLTLVEEPGPNIKVVFDDGASLGSVPTSISYKVRSEATSTLTLSSHSSYNITDYPLAWTFLEVTVNDTLTSFDKSSNIQEFIYKSGLSPNDVLRVRWLANLDYTEIGWKEDSFDLSQWRGSGSITPTIKSDGNILSISWNYIPPNYNPYYYVRDCSISTNSYQFIKIRWKSTGPIAVAHVYFETEGQTLVPYGSESKDWTVTIAELRPNQTIKSVMVGITNLVDPTDISGLQTLYVDYILIGNRAKP